MAGAGTGVGGRGHGQCLSPQVVHHLDHDLHQDTRNANTPRVRHALGLHHEDAESPGATHDHRQGEQEETEGELYRHHHGDQTALDQDLSRALTSVVHQYAGAAETPRACQEAAVERLHGEHSTIEGDLLQDQPPIRILMKMEGKDETMAEEGDLHLRFLKMIQNLMLTSSRLSLPMTATV